jgi:TldD protein
MASSTCSSLPARAFGFDDGRLKTADYSRDAGFGLRGVSGEMTGFAHANEISAEAIRRAGETLRCSIRPRASPPRRRAEQPPPLYRCLAARCMVPFADKVRLLETIDAAARARDPRVAQVGQPLAVQLVGGGDRARRRLRRHRCAPAGAAQRQHRRRTERPARNRQLRHGRARLYDDLFEPETWNRAIDTALAQALVNLESVAAPAGEMTVLLGPGWPGVLLHEAVGHGLEGDFNRKGTSAFSGRIGERVGAPGVTVVDDGSMAGRRGSLSIDDEGTPTRRPC